MTDIKLLADEFILRERSDFQLKHFVIGQHDTPEMRFRQILIEARDLLYKIRHAEINQQISQQKIAKLKNSDDPVKRLKAKSIELDMALMEKVLEGTKRELMYLVELSKDYRHYTSQEIEANQLEYWEKRLLRQANTDRVALEQGVDKGNLASLMQANLLQGQLPQ